MIVEDEDDTITNWAKEDGETAVDASQGAKANFQEMVQLFSLCIPHVN